jgi:phospholipid/cholesterol/gamma-HCH transport system substrate-binding protein
LAFAYGVKSGASVPGYDLVASFDKAEGIGVGSEVRMSGVTIGKVVAQGLDGGFRAVVRIRVDPTVQVPKDSAALIQTDGLLGSKFISLQPGGDESNLAPGAKIQLTQGSMNVQDLLELIVGQAEAKHAGQPRDKAQ